MLPRALACIPRVLQFRRMSFLFHHKTKAVLKWVWIVVAVLIIASMLLVYSGGEALI